MMRALFRLGVGWVVLLAACSSYADERVEIRTVTGIQSVTLPDDENETSLDSEEVLSVNSVNPSEMLPLPEGALSAKTMEELASEPSETRPLAVEAEKLNRVIEQRRREERERRDMEAKLSLIRFRVRQQLRQNEIWYQDALDEEVEYIRDGEEHLEDKEYRDAKDCYLKAIGITYPQWIFADKAIIIIKTDSGWYKREDFEPSFEKRFFHLSTEYTRLALTRLAIVDRLISEHDLITARLKADAAYETGNLGKAYRLYTKALGMARKMARSAFAERYVEEIALMREGLFAEAALPLGMAEAALAASKPSAALAAMDEFREKYADFVFIPDLKQRYMALDGDPMIKHERREQSALKKIAIGDAAVTREDYQTAVRWYRRAATIHAGTEGATLAAQKRDALLADATVVAMIKRQEMENISKAMIARAETFASWGRVVEAMKVYNELIEAYPDTIWAKQALTARKALEALADEALPLPIVPLSTEVEALRD